jgi:GNAT superfamily N-acetyltransferase
MHIVIRPVLDSDAAACGQICFDGFQQLNERHGFPPAFPSVEIATRRVASFIQHPSFFGVVAEGADGNIVGFNFLNERDPIRAVGPIVTDPVLQGRGIGRLLMQAILERAQEAQGIRLMQASYNVQSLSLYASLDFDVRESFIVLTGSSTSGPPQGWEFRPPTQADAADCEELHQEVHGYTRTNELLEAIDRGTAMLAIRGGCVRAYMTAPAAWVDNHGVAETDEDMQALLLGAAQSMPISFFVPLRRANFFRWCIAQGFRAVRPMTLMTIGAYCEPKGSYFPSVQY